MYDRTYWLDHVEDQSGTVIQQGTLLDQAHFNKMEAGIQDAVIASQIYGWSALHQKRFSDANDALMDSEVLGEVHEVTITNNQKFPFNSSIDNPISVALTKTRKNLYYSVEIEVKEHSGLVGEITVIDKALNGFKVSYSGSGSSVTLTVRIKGGMT